jgi:hypothetical protein
MLEGQCEMQNAECGTGAMRNAECGAHSHTVFFLPHSSFRIPHSAFLIPHSSFRIPHSAFRIDFPHPAFRMSVVLHSISALHHR